MNISHVLSNSLEVFYDPKDPCPRPTNNLADFFLFGGESPWKDQILTKMSHEKETSYFPLYWLFGRDP